jgi:stage V sporulation protein B
MESRCEGIIRITAISLPFMCIHNCLSNYYYSQKESLIRRKA